MKTLITTALFIAQLMTNGAFAQETGNTTDEALAERIANEVREEIGLTDSSRFQLTCRITERNEGMAGTGAALVMYSPARVRLVVEFELAERATEKILWTGTLFATGRNTLDEALESATERGAERVSEVMRDQPSSGPQNVVAQSR